MPITQVQPVGNNLTASVVQSNFQALFNDAHTHNVRTSAPSNNEGSVNDIIPVIIGTSFYLYIKFSSGWKKVLLS